MNRFLRNILLLIAASIVLKVAYLVFAYYVLDNPEVLTLDGYSSILNRNDASWYEKIANNWYPEITDVRDLGYSHDADFKQSEWAFFPLYPWLNRVMMSLFHITFNQSGFILSLLFSTLAFIGFYIFCELFTRDPKRSLYCSLVFLLFPFHYYFSMMYSEALFFTLLIFAFISIHNRKYYFIPFLLFPLALVRPFGIIALVPLYLYYLERENILVGYKLDLKTLFSRRNILKSLLFITGPIAFLLYLVYQKQMTDHYFAFSIAQAGWYREFRLPFLSFFRSGDFPTQFNSVFTILLIVFSAFIWKRNPLSLNIFIWLSILVPLCSGSVGSMPRFGSVLFPLTIIVGTWLYQNKCRSAILVLFFALQIFVFYYWLQWHPFSF